MKIKNLKGHKRRILLGVNFLSVFGWSLLSPLYAIYVTELGGNAQTASLAWAFYTLVGGVLIITLGWIENRLIQKERILAIGYLLQTLGTILLFLATNISLMIAGYAVYAVGTGFVTPVWKHVFTKVAVRSHDTSQWGIFDGGNMLLVSAAAAAGSVIYGLAGFKGILSIMVIAHIITAILGLRLAYQSKALYN